MKKIIASIIGTIAVISLLFGVFAFAHGNSDYKTAYAAQMEAARAAKEKARLAACSYIGSLTADCYQGSANACTKLETEEADYSTEFEAESYQDCMANKMPPAGTVLSSGEIVEDQTGIPTQEPLDPLFRGDE